MSTPFISKSWFSNAVTGITYSGVFKNNHQEGKEALDKLINMGLLQAGYFIVNCKKKSYAKTSPNTIRSSSTLSIALNSLGIDIDVYEKSFLQFSLPLKISLNQTGIDLILQDLNYVPLYHLFINQPDFQVKLKQKIDNRIIREVNIKNNKRYILVPNTNSNISQSHSRKYFSSLTFHHSDSPLPATDSSVDYSQDILQNLESCLFHIPDTSETFSFSYTTFPISFSL